MEGLEVVPILFAEAEAIAKFVWVVEGFEHSLELESMVSISNLLWILMGKRLVPFSLQMEFYCKFQSI